MSNNFDIKGWAKEKKGRAMSHGEISSRPDIQEVLKTILEMRAKGETVCSFPQIHTMLQANYDLQLKTSEGLRSWVKNNMSEVYLKAGF